MTWRALLNSTTRDFARLLQRGYPHRTSTRPRAGPRESSQGPIPDASRRSLGDNNAVGDLGSLESNDEARIRSFSSCVELESCAVLHRARFER